MNSINDIWNEILRTMSGKLTQTAINTWFSDCVPLDISDCKLVLSTTTDFKRKIIMNRFGDTLKSILYDIFSCDFELIILTGDEVDDYKDNLEAQNSLPEMAGYTFDKFIVGASNKFAHAAAMAVAEHPGTAYNPLFIYGNSGLGKTHLLLSIGQAIHTREPKLSIAYIKGDEFTNQMVQSIKDGTAEEFRTKYRNVDLFLVDDIQFIAGKQQTQNEFFHTFNNIYEAGHQIVITSDRPPKEMSLLDDRLQTRFEGGLMADIQPPDLETRMAIIRNKAAQLGLVLDSESIEFLAKRITANVRQIEGVVKKLTAYKDILNTTITKEIMEKALIDVLKDGEYIPKPEDVIRETARYFNLSEEEIKGLSKSKNISLARQVAMYLIRTLCNISLKDIGSYFSGRNHATVISSLKKVEELVANDPEMASVIKNISSNINSVN